MSFVNVLRTAIISVNNINRLVFIITVVCVYCEVGTELPMIYMNFRWQRICPPCWHCLAHFPVTGCGLDDPGLTPYTLFAV